MAYNPNPVTRFYEIRAGGGWARLWLTDDCCLAIHSDWGSYGYWWDGPGGESRAFLCRATVDYVQNKLARGRQEYDEVATRKSIRDRILRMRRERQLSHDDARSEWDLLEDCGVDTEIDLHVWWTRTELQLEYGAGVYVTPFQIQGFMKHIWPLFVERMQAELAQEAA